MTDKMCLVSTAIDLSRLGRNPYAEIQLRRLLAVGREVDLLEALRRSVEELGGKGNDRNYSRTFRGTTEKGD